MSRTTSATDGADASAQREREARAWGWVAHLRDGGTTAWSAWGSGAGADEQFGRYLPGAQQLELLRRLNQQQLPSPELAGRVLSASAPGRGRPDLGLVGVLPASAFGPPPGDPSALPADELQLCPSELGPAAIFPMSATRRRVVATIDRTEGDAPSLELVRRILRERAPAGIEAESIGWASYFQIHHRQVAKLRVGRMFVAGDAARAGLWLARC